MTKLRNAQRSPKRRSATLAVGVVVLLLAATSAAAGVHSGERSIGGHRWTDVAWLSAPATSALAVAGIAGIAVHLFRRRRSDKRQHPQPRNEDDWEQRLAQWERRLGDGRRRPDAMDADDTRDDGPRGR